MATIIRHNQEIHFDRIVAYGCSYTAGAELSDYLGFPDISIAESENLKRTTSPHEFYQILSTNMEKHNILRGDLDAYNQEHAWPSYLSKRFGVDCINQASNGASNQYMVHAIERDLANNIIKDTDLIIVGLTSYSRWFYLDNTATPRKPLVGYYSEIEWPTREFYDNYLVYVSGTNDAYAWSLANRHLALLSEKLGHRILVQPLIVNLEDLNDVAKSTNDREFINTITHINNTPYIISKYNSFSTATGHEFSEPWPISHGFGHPTQQQQEKFAEFIYGELTNE